MRDNDRIGWAPPVLRDAGEDDRDMYVIGVRETTDPESWSLMFMECYDADDEQEIALGMDTYCLVVDPGQATYYGGVKECEITDTELRLVLAEDAATALGMPSHARFVLDLPLHQREFLGPGLRRVLTSGRADSVPQLLRV